MAKRVPSGEIWNGQYTLGGGWAGSLRGTFVSGNLHLERIDARRGRDAELKGAFAIGLGVMRSESAVGPLVACVADRSEDDRLRPSVSARDRLQPAHSNAK